MPKTPTCHHVTVANMAFMPASLLIAAGDCVCWTFNEDGHSVVADDGSFSSATPQAVGSTFEHDFTTVGTCLYHCAAMPTMTGAIEVTP